MRIGYAIVVALVLIAALLSSGCTTSQHLGESKGPVFVLNPDHWSPTLADMDVEKN